MGDELMMVGNGDIGEVLVRQCRGDADGRWLCGSVYVCVCDWDEMLNMT